MWLDTKSVLSALIAAFTVDVDVLLAATAKPVRPVRRMLTRDMMSLGEPIGQDFASNHWL